MSFADLQKLHASFVVGHALGESIGYRKHPQFAYTTIKATVRRNPIELTGEVLENAIEVYVSKADVATVNRGNDEVRLVADQQPGKPAPVYRVERVEELPGSFMLFCRR